MNDRKKRIKVIVIDSSAVTRYLLAEILEQTGEIDVVASVHDTVEALNKIRELRPHVITFDVNMPNMNGLSFIETLMEVHPTPVVIVSAMTRQQNNAVIKAMELGAVGFVAKQTSPGWSSVLKLSDELIEKVRAASTMEIPGNNSSGLQSASGSF